MAQIADGGHSPVQAEFAADCWLLAKRTLTPGEFRAFRLGLPPDAAAEAALGRAWSQVRPYALWPITEYFADRRAA